MIYLRSTQEIAKIRAACKIVAVVLNELKTLAKAGVTTKFLEERAEELIKSQNAQPAFKGYRGYPAVICASVNEAVVHGIPGLRQLKDGDILSLDCGVKYQGYYGDAALTVAIGKLKADIEKLVLVTEKALGIAISKAIPNNRVHDISNAIQTYVERNGFSVVRDYVGHGIGSNMHEEPSIPNFGAAGTGPRIKPGMVLAIETMVNMGTYEIALLEDGWTAVTSDGKPSAHFEHTIAVTDNAPEILTTL